MHTIEHSESILTVFPHCSLWNTYYILIYLMKKMHRGAREWDRTATTKTTTTHSASRREWNERDEQMHSVRHCFRLCCSSNPYFRPLFIYFMDFFLLLVLILILIFSQFCALILAPNRLWMLYYMLYLESGLKCLSYAHNPKHSLALILNRNTQRKTTRKEFGPNAQETPFYPSQISHSHIASDTFFLFTLRIVIVSSSFGLKRTHFFFYALFDIVVGFLHYTLFRHSSKFISVNCIATQRNETHGLGFYSESFHFHTISYSIQIIRITRIHTYRLYSFDVLGHVELAKLKLRMLQLP